MSANIGSVIASGWWAAFWLQLPLLVLALAVTIIGVAAVWRARPEDVPQVFEALTKAFGRQPGSQPRSSRRRGPASRRLNDAPKEDDPR